MIIEVAGVPPEGRRFDGEEPPSILDIADTKDLRIERPVGYRLTAHAVSGELIVTGEIETDVLLKCSRCAELFRRRVVEPEFRCVREFADSRECVNLTEDIREAMILAFPSYPVCGPDCKGLCPQCGVNLNMSQCGCTPSGEARWAVLDGLNLK